MVGRRYYVCSNAQKNGRAICPTKSVSSPEIERFVVDRIRVIGSDKNLQLETFRETLRQIRAERRSLLAETKRLTGQADRARKEVDRLVETVGKASGGVQKALLKGLEKAQSSLSRVEARLQEIRARKTELGSRSVDETDLARTLKAFDPIWEVLYTPEKERILRLLIEGIDYDGATEELEITFRPTGIAALAVEVGAPSGKS